MHQLFIDFKKAYDSFRREVLYNILIEFGTLMKLVSLIKMCLNETYKRVWVGKYLSDRFPIKNNLKEGNALLLLSLNFSLEYAIWRDQVIQDGLKLNGTSQVSVYAVDVNIVGGSVHTTKKKAVVLVGASKENELEGTANKTRYMSRNQNAGRRHDFKDS